MSNSLTSSTPPHHLRPSLPLHLKAPAQPPTLSLPLPPPLQGGSNSSEEASRREKYNELCTKERDLAAFVDSFPARRAIKYQEVADGQAQVAAALERIGRLQALAAGGLPSAGQFRELQDELQYKKMQLENSQVGAVAVMVG
jgi:hypothetical protein